MQAQLVSAAVADGGQPQILAAVSRGASPSVEDLQREAGIAIYDLKGVGFTCRTGGDA